MTVYAQGYDETGIAPARAATKFEEDEFLLITDPEQIWKMARRKIAVSTHRDINAQLRCKMAHLVVREGHRVSVTRPETGWGLASGRVVSAAAGWADLSRPVAMVAGRPYSIGFTRSTDTGVTRIDRYLMPKAADGNYTRIEFATRTAAGGWVAAPLAAGDIPLPDAQFQFGEVDFVARDFMVAHIAQHDDDQATLHLYPAGTEIFDAVGGAWPGYTSRISDTPVSRLRPPRPAVTGVVSDERVMVALPGGGWAARLVVHLVPPADPPGGVLPAIGSVQIRYRRTGAGQWALLSRPPGTDRIDIADIEEGVAYDIDVIYIGVGGLVSDAAEIRGHVVVGKSTPPPDPEGLYVDAAPGGRLAFRVAGKIARDHAGWRFRWRAGPVARWDNATSAHAGLHQLPVLEVAPFADGAFTVMVRAVDIAGNESTGMATAVARVGRRYPGNIVARTDLAARGFPGSVTGGRRVGKTLSATASSALFADGATPLFTDVNAALFSTYTPLIYVAEVIPARDGMLAIDLDADGNSGIEYAVPDDAPLFTVGGRLFDNATDVLFGMRPWTPKTGPVRVTGDQTVRIRLKIDGGPVQGVIRRLNANIEVPMETEELSDVAIPAAGGRLQLSRAWAEIIKIEVTVQQAPDFTADRVVIADKTASGPLIKGYGAGGPAPALIDATIKGILQ